MSTRVTLPERMEAIQRLDAQLPVAPRAQQFCDLAIEHNSLMLRVCTPSSSGPMSEQEFLECLEQLRKLRVDMNQLVEG